MAKRVKLYLGVQDELKEVTVQIPDDDPRPWDGRDRLKCVGQRLARSDGEAKVTGAAKYTFDIELPGMLHAKFLRSPYPAAIVRAVDISRARKASGVVEITMASEKLPMTLRWVGQEILAIAAKTSEQAENALKLVKVDYERKRFVLNVDEAKKPGAPQVYDSIKNGGKTTGNVRGPEVWPEKSRLQAVDKALAESDAVVAATYRTQVQTHSALETHCAVAKWEENHLTVWISTQGLFVARDGFATALDIPKTRVKVICNYIGGAFGAKFQPGTYGLMAARMAKKTGLPVRIVCDRKEEHLAGGNRPNSVQELKIGASDDGKIEAIKLLSYGTSGVATGAGTAAPAKFMYECDNIYTEEADVFTNASPGTYFRAPGHPQGVFALEQSIDDLAYRLKIDPLELRKRNVRYRNVRLAEYEIGAKKIDWDSRNLTPGTGKGAITTGIGMANSIWFNLFIKGCQAKLQVNSDGSLELSNGVQDLGTGIRTLIAMVVAEELGLDPQQVAVKIGDSDLGFGPLSGGSMTTNSLTPAVRNAAYLAGRKMREIAATALETTVDKLCLADGKIFVATKPTRSLTWKQAAAMIPGDNFSVIGERKEDYIDPPAHICGVQFAKVEVDTGTGQVRVKRVVAVHDCGRAMNRLTLENQIYGGIIQGISYALFENRVLDPRNGVMLNPNMEQYKIAGTLDVPEIEAVVIDVFRGHSSTGAIGIGEPATIPTAAAIANAVYHAIGVRIRDLPMTPDRILAALKGGA